jgi:serine/threonine protein kinase
MVGLRRILRGPAFDSGVLERITDAGFAAMELRHPRVLAVLDVVVAGDQIAIVSELFGGAVLKSLLRAGNGGVRPVIPAPTAVRLAIDLLEALQAVQRPWLELFPEEPSEDERAVARGIHGGLMPDTVFVASFGEAMLVEVGISGGAMTAPSLREHPSVLAYRAPEQLSGEHTIDERADVFTIGVLLWELIAGRSLYVPSVLPRPAGAPASTRTPNEASRIVAVRDRILGVPAPRLDELPLLKGKVSTVLSNCVARCLERERTRRFQSVGEAIDAFKTLDARAVGTHDAVTALLVSLGAPGTADEAPRDGLEGLGSNRPTSPPSEAPLASTPSALPFRADELEAFEPFESTPLDWDEIEGEITSDPAGARASVRDIRDIRAVPEVRDLRTSAPLVRGVTEDEPSPREELQPAVAGARRKRRLGVGIAVAAAAVLVLLLVGFGAFSPSRAAPREPGVSPAPPLPVQSPTPDVPAPPASLSAITPTAPAPSSSGPGRSSVAPVATREAAPPPHPVAATHRTSTAHTAGATKRTASDSKKPFRPSGI